MAVVAAVAAGVVLLRRRHPAPAPVRAAAALSLPASSDVILTGIIRPQHVVNVGASAPGFIEEFLGEAGQEVYQDQSLAKIGSPSLESVRANAAAAAQRAEERVSRAEAALNSARMEESRADAAAQRARLGLTQAQAAYNKQKTWMDAGATPRNVFQKAENDYQEAVDQATLADKARAAARDLVRSSEKLLDQAKQELADRLQDVQEATAQVQGAEVRSPADGLVIARSGSVGQNAQEVGDQMFLIATDIYALEAPLQPPPPVLARLHPGMQAMVTVAEALNSPIAGEVKEIQGATVVVQFTSPIATVKPGMKADVRFRME